MARPSMTISSMPLPSVTDAGRLRRHLFGARGPYFRGAATKLVERMQADLSIDILPRTHERFLAGLGLYQARLDKDRLPLYGGHAP